ncbi:MAG: PD-(D/E)XK nuclease family protein [Acidobacteria bacterium]|nr:PD-(D/E)XK nuclease family protein [Acidobacteriota bacterium]
MRLLSVHKAKGLEYPVVVIPDVGRGHARNERGRSREAQARWLPHEASGFVAARLTDGSTNLAWAKLAGLDRRHEMAEEKRVLYVACTRAREKLILVNSEMGKGAAPWRDALAALGYHLRDGIPAGGPLGAEGVTHRIVESGAPSDRRGPVALDPIFGDAARGWQAVAASAAGSAAPPLRRPTGEREAREDEDRERRLFDDTGRAAGGRRDGTRAAVARCAGSAVHVALEGWNFAEGAALKREARAAAERLADLEVAPLRGEIVEEVEEILDGFLVSALPARLAGLAILGREIPVLFDDGKNGGGVWRGYCDLVYRDADGGVVVADYKTSRTESDEAAAEAARAYGPQLAVYRGAIERAIPGAVVRAEILFVRSGRVVRL